MNPLQYLLERLSAQKLEPKDLRTFLRLGDPLACLNDEEMTQKCDEIQGQFATTPGKAAGNFHKTSAFRHAYTNTNENVSFSWDWNRQFGIGI